MKRLDSYEVLNNEVFYRGMHILDYLYSNERISDLDIEAIKATILCALVERNLIDPEHEFLDLRTMSITKTYYFGCEIYNPKPFVQGFPLWMKEKLRTHALKITGSLPVSVRVAKPSGGLGFCVYDVNTALSVIFDDFSFIVADYDSPTRPGKKAKDRPFLEANIDGITYLFDILTKRMFEKKEFTRRYNMEVKHVVRKSQFDEAQRNLYEEQTTEDTSNYGVFLSMTMPVIDAMRDYPKMQEYLYEIEKSKKIFPRAFEEIEEIKADMKAKGIGQLKLDVLSSEK